MGKREEKASDEAPETREEQKARLKAYVAQLPWDPEHLRAALAEIVEAL